MAVDATLMFREVDLVASSGQGDVHYRIDVQILAAGVWYTPFKLDHWSQERDYENAWGESSVIQFMIGAGTYTYNLLANRDNLVVDLKFVPLVEGSNQQRSDLQAKIYRYRGILMNQDDPTVANKHSQGTNAEALDRVSTATVEMQLINETSYRMNMVTTGRIFRQMTPMDAVYALFTESITKVGGDNSQRILGINAVAGFNTEKRNLMTIEHGLRMTQVVKHMQDKEGGLYPTGAGAFIQDQYWWVYPLYDTERVNKKLKTLKVYNVPSNRLDGAERTYRTTTNQVIILCTGDASATDPSLIHKLTDGNGVRFADARKLLGSFATLKDNRMLFDRATNLFEMAGSKLNDTFNNISWAKDGATSNPFKHYSEMAKKQGQIVNMTWRYGDSDLLMPGMPVEFSTIKDDNMYTYKGTLLGVHEQRIPAESGAQASKHPSSIVLKLFVNTSAEVG